ncbi:MAG: alpha-2-macroglobulin [Hellea sp.]
MKRNFLLAVAIIGAFFFASWAGYNFYDSSDKAALSPNSVKVEKRSQSSSTPETVLERKIDYAKSLRYLGWEADTSGTSPKACFNFSQKLKAGTETALRDYVVTQPKIPVNITINGSQMCASGFDFEKDYSLTLRAGLPSAEEKIALESAQTVEISFGDKPGFVGFAGQGIILPRSDAQGMAIETVNVEQLDVVVYRVTDRILSQLSPAEGEATLEGRYSYDYAANNKRVKIWGETVPVKKKRNEKVTTVLPMQDIIDGLEPGAYIVTAKDTAKKERPASAFRWFMSTDMALTSYRGENGLTVSVRSIETAQLQRGVKLKLIAANNEILSEKTTNATGRVKFDGPLIKGTGASSPTMVMAYGGENDYAILDLQRSPLDLSDFDIGGRNVSGDVDVYGFAERGVYRPGETAHLTVMLRDTKIHAIEDRPVTLKVQKPNKAVVFTKRFETAPEGGVITWDYEVPVSAPRGIWTVLVEADGAGQVGRISFSVEDFVPQKLRLGIDVDETPLRSGEIRDVVLDAQFLYGAPGGALEGEAEARLELDPKPFKDFADYSFGPTSEKFRERLIDMGGGITDGDGKLTLGLDLKNNKVSAGYPLRVQITGGVAEPGGRYVRDSLRIPVRTEDSYIGVRPDFLYGYASSKKPVSLDLVAMNYKGERVTSDVSWRLVEEDYDWYWYRERGRWRYRRDVRDVDVTKGDVKIAAGEPMRWTQRLPRGRYRLDLEGKDGAIAEYRFGVGWGSGSRGTDAPDKITMGAPERPQNPGDSFTLAINAPYAGQGDLVIANSDVHVVQTISLEEGESEIRLPFDESWGDGVYAMLTLYTPRDKAGQPVPRRAVGVSYIGLDRTKQTLDLTINAPDVIRPRKEHVFTVDVKNAPRGETVWMNFAAVDEGILQLTKYRSPDSAGHFFGKKALGITLRDDYARILNPNLGQPVNVRTGGDSLGGEGLTVVPTRTVSLFSGLVKVKGGTATIALDIPDFNGELRLMATAWSETAIGSGSSALKVRDKVPAILGLPRFLAPGDKALATVSLDNVEGDAGTYKANLSSEDIIRSGGNTSFKLAQGQREEDKLDISAAGVGTDVLTLDVSGPGAYAVTSTFPIEVRAPYMDETVSSTKPLAAGETLTLTKSIIEKYLPRSAEITVSASQLAGIDPAPYIKSLRKYPYGCTEQTVSAAMPMLYVEDLGGFDDMADTQRRREIQKSVNRLVLRQSLDGAFGLWRSGDRYASPWLGVYATDFLQRAGEEGAYVPEDVMERAYTAAREISQMPRYSSLRYNFDYGWRRNNSAMRESFQAQGASYAHYVLAKAGKGDLSAMRYHFDNHRGKMKSPMGYAYLGKALFLMGDKSRAAQAFEEGIAISDYDNAYDYYQSPLRDTAGFVALGAGHLEDNMLSSLVEDLQRRVGAEEYANTNQKAHVILALKSLLATSSKPSVKAKGMTLKGPTNRPAANMLAADLNDKPSLTNTGEKQVWVTTTINGIPKKAPEPSATAFTIAKTFYRMDGTEFDGKSLKQGERLIVKLRYASKVQAARMVVIADLLPAGFEIETILQPKDGLFRNGKKGPYQWLGEIAEFDIAEARDDRFVASKRHQRWRRYEKGETAAYIVRAVTPGEFAMPGALIEDMYRPQDLARTAVGKVRISSDNAL